MFYLKVPLANGIQIQAEVRGDNVFTHCNCCGNEMPVDLADVFADGDPAEDDTPSDEDVITEEDADMDADEETAGDENEHDERTPAQIAADLDFYTDGDHADGESYDPMTLAAQITSRNSRPKISDFMKTVPSDEN